MYPATTNGVCVHMRARHFQRVIHLWILLIFCSNPVAVRHCEAQQLPAPAETQNKQVLGPFDLSNGTPVNEYVDSRLCARCHSQIYENYRQTGMAKSLFKPAPANTIEDYKGNTQFYHSLSDTHYSMIFRDHAYYQRRWQIGSDGNETNVEEMKIDYVIGAGDHSRSYLHRTTRGTLIELPLGWYTERGGYWGMSPGFDSRHPQTRRLVSYGCVFCHDGYPQVPSGSDVPGADPVFTGGPS